MKTNAIRFDVFVGPAGAGKDTFTQRLTTEVPRSTRLSTGDICRGAKSGEGRYGYGFYHELMAEESQRMEQGALVSDRVALELTRHAVMKAFAFGTDRFFMTGFPRNVAQLDIFDNWTRDLEILTGHPVEARFVHLDLDPDMADSRRIARVEEALAKGQEPRKDDREDVFLRRGEEYRAQTIPLINELERQGRLKKVHVNGSIENNYCGIREAVGLTHHFSHPERR